MDLFNTKDSRPPPSMKLFQDPPAPSTLQRRASISGDSTVRPLSSISENIQQPKRTMQRSQSFIQPSKGIGVSPTKKRNPNPLLPYTSVFQGQLDSISMPPPEMKGGFYNGSPQKKPPFSRFDTSLPNIKQPQKQETLMPKYTNAKAAFHPIDKENYIPNIPNTPTPKSKPPSRASSAGLQEVEKKLLNALSSKDPNLVPNPPRPSPPQDKPPLLEAAPIKEKPAKKVEPRETRELSEVPIPEPQEMPAIIDDGEKPSYSYATLIGMAILRAPNRRLTLAQIYKWISDTFAYYRTSDHGWQNSIRHNLSLNKALIRQERPKDEPGKGSYWTIKEGQEYQFITGKGGNKRASTGKKGADKATKKGKDGKDMKEEGLKLEKQVEVPSTPLPQVPNMNPTAILEDTQTQISSDATRTATPSPRNSFSIENNFLGTYNNGLMAAPPIPQSSPPPLFRSSPPVTRPNHSIPNQTPPQTFFPSSTRKRKQSLMGSSINDSGYFSSLESSVSRGGDESRRFKRGRAEEDIARIRRSTISESPLLKMTMGPKGYHSSSPVRQYNSSSFLGQLTPATTLRPTRQQQQAPLSASPNTNLKMFRSSIHEMVGSPAPNVETLSEESLEVLFDTFVDRSPYSTSGSADINNMKSPCPPSRIAFSGSPYKSAAPRRFPPVDPNFLNIPTENQLFGNANEDDMDEDTLANSFLFTNAL